MNYPALETFALATLLLALAAALVHRVGFPPLPIYLLMGLWVGEGLEVEALEPLPSLGLILLLFSVGLEFGPDRIRTLSQRGLAVGLWELPVLALGFLLGLALGLGFKGALLLAGVFYVSSSAVIVKLLIDQRRTANPESEGVLGALVLEDAVVVLLLALLGGEGLTGLLLGVLLTLLYLFFARYLGPLLANLMMALSDELVLLLGAGLTVGTALLFHALGASEGIGAFLAGVVTAALGLRERFERLFGPVRDLGVALFFLVVGAQAGRLLEGVGLGAFFLALLGLGLKMPFNWLGAKGAGLGPKRRLYTALYLLPRGEFNLILGAVALASGQALVAQVATLMVLLSIPLGALAMRFAPSLGARLYPKPPKPQGVFPEGTA